jgi:hypothetical protein
MLPFFRTGSGSPNTTPKHAGDWHQNQYGAPMTNKCKKSFTREKGMFQTHIYVPVLSSTKVLIKRRCSKVHSSILSAETKNRGYMFQDIPAKEVEEKMLISSPLQLGGTSTLRTYIFTQWKHEQWYNFQRIIHYLHSFFSFKKIEQCLSTRI